MTGRGRAIAFAAAMLLVVACDERLNPRVVGINRPPIDVPSGDFNLVAVDDLPLPRTDTSGGTIYKLTSGSFSLHGDSTWLFSTMESLSGTNGVFIGNSPANYQGKWTVTDSTIAIQSYGSMKVKGDTLFWRGGPKHSFQDTLKFTLVRK
jgi:hypothetical protein